MGLSVMVTNADRITSPSVFTATDITIGDEGFIIDCFALDLGGFDIALGVHWLRTLGPIVWDFESLMMAFWYGGLVAPLARCGRVYGGCPCPHQPMCPATVKGTSSRSPAAYPWNAATTIGSTCCRALRRWPRVHIATCSY